MNTVILRKYDNGYRAVVTRSTTPDIAPGTVIQNRKLHSYKPGSLLEAVFTVSDTGRKMLKSAVPIEDYAPEEIAPMPEKLAPVPAAEVTYGFYVSKESRLNFNTALRMSKDKPERAVKMMMVGASGYGKTTTPQKFASLLGYRFLRMNCATIRDPEEWFGYREARNGSTVFVKSEFAKAIEAGNLVVVLDEFNRLEPWLHNTLFPLLDDDGKTVVHDTEFKIGSNVIVVGTINTGYKYTGTFELDEALYNRFDFVLEVGPMPQDEEIQVLKVRTGVSHQDARKITKMANMLRDKEVICSTRSTLLCAQMMVAGMTVREAFESAVVRRLPVDARKDVVDELNSQLGHCAVRDIEGDIFGWVPSEEEEAAPQQVASKEKGTLLTLTMKCRHEDFLFIRAIKTLRLLPLPEPLSLVDAKGITEELRKGNPFQQYLVGDLSESLRYELERCGLEVR